MSRLGTAMGTQRPKKRNCFYPTTDPRAIPPLLAHVPPGTVYAEPCAGDGWLIHQLDLAGLNCAWGLELEPQRPGLFWPIARGNALTLSEADCEGVDMFITNPPWDRGPMHQLIRHLSALRPVWMLFDASWPYTKQAARFAPLCSDIVAVGRLKWFEGSRYDPPDDCAWYRFDAKDAQTRSGPRFHFAVDRGEAARAGQGLLI